MGKFTSKTQFVFSNTQFVIPALSQFFASFQIEYQLKENSIKAIDDDWTCEIQVDGDTISIDIETLTLALLPEMKEAVLAYLNQLSPDTHFDIQWVDGENYEKKRQASFSVVTVNEVIALTPHMRRIIFFVEDIALFNKPEYLHCKLLFPNTQESAVVWPALNEQGLLKYPNDKKEFDIRTYTIRSVNTINNELTIDMLMHEDGGPGSSWVTQAKKGDKIGLLGPIGKPFTLTNWMLLVGDETALPAISRILETMPPESKGIALIEIENEKDILPLKHPSGVNLQWICRHKNENLNALMTAVKNSKWPEDKSLQPFVWAGVEFDTFKALRHYFFDELSIEKQQQLIVSYWRKGKSESAADEHHD